MGNYWKQTITYSQISAEELKRKAEESSKNAKKRGKELHPIMISRRSICGSWWGQAWCQNIEAYADYTSRLDRGKRYVRSGAVIDLQIQKGKITARVQGQRKSPYKVEIHISPMKEEDCQSIMKECGRKIENLQALINGEFSDDMKAIFTSEHGLFPTPKEISYQCSCPDWALMCKHVAAVLYGIGVRFDENPFLFFELRGIDVDQFVQTTLQSKVETMLQHANVHSPRILDDECVYQIFGF